MQSNNNEEENINNIYEISKPYIKKICQLLLEHGIETNSKIPDHTVPSQLYILTVLVYKFARIISIESESTTHPKSIREAHEWVIEGIKDAGDHLE